jgi:hypothetical protein
LKIMINICSSTEEPMKLNRSPVPWVIDKLWYIHTMNIHTVECFLFTNFVHASDFQALFYLYIAKNHSPLTSRLQKYSCNASYRMLVWWRERRKLLSLVVTIIIHKIIITRCLIINNVYFIQCNGNVHYSEIIW